MRDYEELFARAVHEKIKEAVVGKVYVRVIPNDELLVEITSHGDIVFRKISYNFSKKIINGWSAQDAAYDAVDDYRRFIKSKFFK